MTVIKEPINTRPSSQHRHSSSIASSLPKSRPHSHSLSHGSIHNARMTRRKSVSTAQNMTAMQAAAKGIVGAPLEPHHSTSARRPSKNAMVFRGPPMLQHSPAMASSVPNNASAFGPAGGYAKTEHVVSDGPPLAAMHESEKGSSKSRIRRASEGSRLNKGDGKKSGSELKCDKCGKGYKHSSCLTKHLWEHTPQWQVTSKLLISKHQQVQLLEAASVLLKMNGTIEENAIDSDNSPSPPASGGESDLRDELSSTDTTPPPQLDEHTMDYTRPHYGQQYSKRYSANSSSAAFSQSYQSAVFSDHGPNHHYRNWSNASDRPTTSGTSVGSYQEDENDQESLAAAVGLLSCSYSTPKSGPVTLPPDVPPVPPLPTKFMAFNQPDSFSGTISVTPQQSSLRGNYHYHRKQSQDVDMEGGNNYADEDEDGVFGRMEE